MQIIISNKSKQPIYEQITIQVKELILKGVLKEGDVLPSMRQLAKDLQISVITTKRAYEELEAMGFIHSVVGKGSFVSEQNAALIKEMKLKAVEDQLIGAIQNSTYAGISLEELIEMLTLLYKEEN